MDRGGNFMKATKIKMKSGYEQSENLLEIEYIYLESYTQNGYYKKEIVYELIKNQDRVIYVNEKPYPRLQVVLNSNREKYVCLKPNAYLRDNLLCLPRE